MSETFDRWLGRTVDGRFPLQGYLGGSDHSAVYLTVRQGGAGDSEKAAIRLIPAASVDAEKQLLRWKAASDLSHPNLIRLFEAGRCELDGTPLLYAVEEYAEENLSQILPDRALTAEETTGMLPPVLRALQYLHDQGFVHGHIQPSNILAVADQVKLSSDTLGVSAETCARAATAYDPPEAVAGATSTARDVWQLGTTLVEVLSRLPGPDRVRAPGALPEPFREIAEHCLQVDVAKRWTVAQILGRLAPDQPVPTSAQAKMTASVPAVPNPPIAIARWPYLLAVAAVVAVGLFLMARRPKTSGPGAEDQLTQSQPGAASPKPQPAPAPIPPEPKPSPATPGDSKAERAAPEAGRHQKTPANIDSANTGSASTHNQSGVVLRVMPQVSPSARRTIQGRIKVRVRVEVDAAGNVAKAELESAGPSQYFARVATQAAREWKFSRAQPSEPPGAREWKLQFAFSRARTEVSAVRTKG